MQPVVLLTCDHIPAENGLVFHRLFRTYTDAILRAGGFPLIVPAQPDAEVLERLADAADGLLLTGGCDLRAEIINQPLHEKTEEVPLERDMTEILLTKAFFNSNKPILAICRGEQVVNHVLGGVHCQHLFDRPEVTINHQNKETRHPVSIVPGTLLAEIFDGAEQVTVNSTHHQCVEVLAPALTLNAVSPDGVIECYSYEDRLLATQWHPERLVHENMRPIFDWFVGKCVSLRDEK